MTLYYISGNSSISAANFAQVRLHYIFLCHSLSLLRNAAVIGVEHYVEDSISSCFETAARKPFSSSFTSCLIWFSFARSVIAARSA